MTHRAQGPFEVKITPQPPGEGDEPTIGRMSLVKQFHGALEATSQGTMLAVGTPVKGSAGYVAMERVTGTLDGKRGSFALHHMGTMTRGAPGLQIVVVPDSGTDELTGLAGSMDVQITEGKHAYDFVYTLG